MKEAPPQLIYLSVEKLQVLARQHGVRTAYYRKDVNVESSGQATAPVAPGNRFSANARISATRVDPNEEVAQLLNVLKKVRHKMEEHNLPDIDGRDCVIHDGDWFRFSRDLRFGVGTDDGHESVCDLVLVDRFPASGTAGRPGLLLNGSPSHLWPPYRPADGDSVTGARSGSGSGRLFRWLHAARSALENDPATDLNLVREPLFDQPLPADDTKIAVAMYELFAQDDWLANPRFPAVLDRAPCRGLAQASFVAASDRLTVLMGSPLYVEIRPAAATSREGSTNRGRAVVPRLRG